MKISIILTNYNYQDYIKEAIDSVLAQTYQNWELIISDNCSTDNSWEIINSYDDPRIKKIRNETNLGSTGNFNNAYQYATADLIAILHADDYWMPTKLEKQIEAVNKGDLIFTSADTNKPEYKHIFAIKNINWLQHFYGSGNCLCHSAALVHRRVFDKIGLHSGEYTQLQDYELWVKALLAGFKIYLVEEKLAFYRFHEKTLSCPNQNNVIASNIERAKILQWFTEMSLEKLHELFTYPVPMKEQLRYFYFLCNAPTDLAGQLFKSYLIEKCSEVINGKQ